MQDDRRHQRPKAQSAPPTTPGAKLSPSILQDALTPRGLFTNLFPATFALGNLGTLQATEKARKEELADRKRPRFYQSGETCYAYGAGLDEFEDPRFTPSILPPERDPYFALHLVKFGILDYLRTRGYLVRRRLVGISVIDHEETIAEAEKGFLTLLPEYTFQTFLLEGAQGTPIFALSIEAGWATVPAFELGPRMTKRPDLLQNLKVVLRCKECSEACPLHGRLGGVAGVFDSFAPDGTALTSSCRHEDYTPQPVYLRQRVRTDGPRKPGAKRASAERTVVVPGQVLRPASGQRRVLKLFHDKDALELEGRVWLGDLTRSRNIRPGGLQVRYEHIQRFLSRVANHPTNDVSFPIATGPIVTLGRVPVMAEELAYD
jgi:hypothetical protein